MTPHTKLNLKNCQKLLRYFVGHQSALKFATTQMENKLDCFEHK